MKYCERCLGRGLERLAGAGLRFCSACVLRVRDEMLRSGYITSSRSLAFEEAARAARNARHRRTYAGQSSEQWQYWDNVVRGIEEAVSRAV